jgi:two-component system capsular synthesis response regulator RcsB
MIKKIIIAEDYESTNLSLQKTIEELGIDNPDHVYYCDDALRRIHKCKQDNDSYDLLITDLYFDDDQQIQDLKGGIELIAAARRIQPDLKVLVFSAEGKPAIIESLFNTHGIDGYVRKARNDTKELKLAINNIANNQSYYPRHLIQLVKKKNTHEFTEYDIAIISLLASGMRQKDIPAYLQDHQIRPWGLSSVEKRLSLMREVLEMSKNEQLVAYCKDMGII